MLICDAISGAVCVSFSSGGTSFYRPHSRNLRGAPPRAILDPPGVILDPLDRFWPPLGHPWSDFVDFLKDFGSRIAPNFKDSRATIVTNHTFKKQAKIQKQFTNNPSNHIICIYLFRFTKPRKSEAQRLKKIGSAELPKG